MKYSKEKKKKRMRKREIENKEDEWKNAWDIAYQMENEEKQTTNPESLFDNDDPEEQPPEICPVCDALACTDSSGLRMICPKCGIVVENFTDDKPEWNMTQDKNSGVADAGRGDVINPLMPYASMNTEIVPTGRMEYRQYKMIKLNRWGAMSAMERSLCVVFTKIERSCTRHKVPGAVQYTSKSLFRRVYEINLRKHESGDKREGLRGVKRDGLIAACTYMAFKIHNLYWKKDIVAKVYEISAAEIRRGISIFWDLVKECPLTGSLSKITGCKQYIRWFSVELDLPRAFSTFAERLFKNLKQYGIGSSKQPQSVAAWCIWTVCQALKPEMTMLRIVEHTGISKATITDVERFTAGAEKAALASVFAYDLCSVCEITNPLTVFKINNTVRTMCRTKMVEQCPLWHLAGFAIYFVLTINNMQFNENILLSKCQLSRKDVFKMAQCVIPFRNAIISGCIGHIHFANDYSGADVVI